MDVRRTLHLPSVLSDSPLRRRYQGLDGSSVHAQDDAGLQQRLPHGAGHPAHYHLRNDLVAHRWSWYNQG